MEPPHKLMYACCIPGRGCLLQWYLRTEHSEPHSGGQKCSPGTCSLGQHLPDNRVAWSGEKSPLARLGSSDLESHSLSLAQIDTYQQLNSSPDITCTWKVMQWQKNVCMSERFCMFTLHITLLGGCSYCTNIA